MFLNVEAISSFVVVSDFGETGEEQWYVRAYGYFQLPDNFVAPDGAIVIGPFNTKQEAIKVIVEADEEIVFEVEKDGVPH